MKKITMIILLLIISTFQVAYGEESTNITEKEVETSVTINNGYLKSDVDHMLIGDTVFVEAKSLVQAFGGIIQWDGTSRTVSITLEDKNFLLQVDSTEASVNGQAITLYKAPYIQAGRTMLPLKIVSEYFGSTVTWDASTYTAAIVNDSITVAEEFTYERPYTDEDLYTLSKIVTVESGEQSFEMALAIANTVLNRVKDSRFPNTVADVIYQVDVYTQFPPAHRESFKTLQPGYLSKIAAKRALDGLNNIGQSLYFNNQPFKSKKDDLIRIIDGEYFYN